MVGVTSSNPTQGTASLRKALRLISEVAAAQEQGFRLTEIVGRSDLDPATAHIRARARREQHFHRADRGA
jgi:hypothetical protein